MDITTASKKLSANKFINAETVSWGISFFAVSLLFLVLKQLFKVALSLSAPVSCGIAAVISAAVLFVLERKFVFPFNARTTTPKQIVFYIFRCLIDFGFYKIASFVFVTLLKQKFGFVFFVIFFIYLFFNYYFDRLIVFDCRKKASDMTDTGLYRVFFRNRFIAASMGLAFLSFVFIYLVSTLFPFGDLTVLRMDLYHQYGPLFCELYDRVTHFQSFLYSWNSGGGSSFLGNYFNYLSSPLSAVIFLFDRKDMPYAITTLVALKGILSAGTFTLYLKHSQKSHSLVSAAFGGFYAFCSYFLAYYWNIMWLDGMILFPLIILGIERIIKYGKPACYVASLTVLLYSTYYIGYMTCLFSVIYFFAYFVIEGGSSKLDEKAEYKANSIKSFMNNRFLNRGVIFAVSSVLCAMLCAVTLIPVFIILQGASATSDSPPTTFSSYFELLNLITSHLAGLETTIRSSGDDVLPNIYCSVLSVILLPLYIVNNKIRMKEKIVYVLLIIFFVFSFNNNWFNFVWHALHFPNDLPYRFSFMYSFFILVIAFRGLKFIKAVQYRDVAFCGMLWIFAVIIMQKFMTNKMSEYTIYLNIALILVWTAFLLVLKKGKMQKFILGLCVFCVAFCEIIVADMNSFVFTQYEKDYVVHYDTYREAIKNVYGNDKGFYRLELSYLDTRMDPCLYGYRGMSTFSSMAYEDYSQNQYSLGNSSNRINSYTYNAQTPVYNMMYALKYIIKTDESIQPSAEYYTNTYTTKDNKAEVYENDYYLPVAFCVSEDIKKWVVEEGNPFEAQEEFIDRAAGVSDVFVPAEIAGFDTDGTSTDEITENGTYYFSKLDKDTTTASIDIDIKNVRDGNLYVYITSPEIENVNYSWDNEEHTHYQNIDEPNIIDLGYHKKGEIVTASLECGSIDAESSFFDIYAYNVDNDVFTSAYELLEQGAFNIESFSDSKLSGTVNAGYDGYLYTSIPYDRGWSIYIDGKKAEIFEIADCQLGCKISAGEHRITLKYEPRGLLIGAAISGAAWLALIGYFLQKKFKIFRKKDNIVETV